MGTREELKKVSEQRQGKREEGRKEREGKWSEGESRRNKKRKEGKREKENFILGSLLMACQRVSKMD